MNLQKTKSDRDKITTIRVNSTLANACFREFKDCLEYKHSTFNGVNIYSFDGSFSDLIEFLLLKYKDERAIDVQFYKKSKR